jgi:hypothetical protein
MKFPSAPALALIVAVALSTPAEADPITAQYDVHVFYRQYYQTLEVVPFESRFTLQLRYDPGTATPETGTYGPASFSAVPLPVEDAPRDQPLRNTAGTHHFVGVDSDDPSAFQRQARASSTRESLPGAPLAFFFLISLENNFSGLATLPVANANTFPHHLGLPVNEGRFYNFLYAGSLYQGSGRGPGRFIGNSFIYYGQASLTDVSAVPEPTTVSLLIGGLGLLAVRRKAHRDKGSDSGRTRA